MRSNDFITNLITLTNNKGMLLKSCTEQYRLYQFKCTQCNTVKSIKCKQKWIIRKNSKEKSFLKENMIKLLLLYLDSYIERIF